MNERERLSSRLGFIMLSAGCAIGCGNVWKFPWMCGQNGGGSFMLLYILCLLVLGLPVMVMVFAALSTVLGVCENILAMVRELTGWSRPKGCVVCGVGIFLLALTTALGYSVLHFQPFAPGSAWLDFWDFIVSNNVLPLGSLVLALFCCNRFGWGWDNFVAEANTGRGLKVRPWMKPIFKYFVPGAILFIYIYGMVTFHWR